MQLTGCKEHANVDGLTLYHKDIFVPVYLQNAIIKRFIFSKGRLYTSHAFERMQSKGIPDIDFTTYDSTIIEYKVDYAGILQEILLRVDFNATTALCYVITVDGIIKTVYARHIDDNSLRDVKRYASFDVSMPI